MAYPTPCLTASLAHAWLMCCLMASLLRSIASPLAVEASSEPPKPFRTPCSPKASAIATSQCGEWKTRLPCRASSRVLWVRGGGGCHRLGCCSAASGHHPGDHGVKETGVVRIPGSQKAAPRPVLWQSPKLWGRHGAQAMEPYQTGPGPEAYVCA